MKSELQRIKTAEDGDIFNEFDGGNYILKMH